MAKLFECTMSKISRPDIEGGLRTEEVKGVTGFTPAKDKTFIMMAKSLTDYGFDSISTRYVETSPVTEVVEEGENEWVVTTMSGSKYNIKIGNEIEETS